VLGVANATDGLHLAARAAGIGPGDEVILSSHTMIATAAAVHFAGATPIPVDCGSDHLIDPAAVEAAITPRTRAIMPTHLNGRTCDMDALQSLASKHSLTIVEDAAQGSALSSKAVLRERLEPGRDQLLSAKVLGCFGDGGAVIAGNQQIYDRLYQLRDHGRSAAGEIESWGLNSRLDNLQAAFLGAQFNDYGQVVSRRRAIARLYTDRLWTSARWCCRQRRTAIRTTSISSRTTSRSRAPRRFEAGPQGQRNRHADPVGRSGCAPAQGAGFTQKLESTDGCSRAF